MTVPHITIEQVRAMYSHCDEQRYPLFLEAENSLIDAYNEKQTNEQFRIMMKQKLCDGSQSANIYQAAALKQPTPWTGSREDVLALLAEFKVI